MLRELISAFIPIRMGMINDTPSYWRKRLFHKGYQILLKRSGENEYYIHHGNYDTLTEVFEEIVAK